MNKFNSKHSNTQPGAVEIVGTAEPAVGENDIQYKPMHQQEIKQPVSGRKTSAVEASKGERVKTGSLVKALPMGKLDLYATNRLWLIHNENA